MKDKPKIIKITDCVKKKGCNIDLFELPDSTVKDIKTRITAPIKQAA